MAEAEAAALAVKAGAEAAAGSACTALPRRELGGVVAAEHAVARLEVRRELLGLPDVVPHAREGS